MENFDKFLLKKFEKLGGFVEVYKFPNNYGASIACHNCSYGGSMGLKELAVIVFLSDNPFDYRLDYETPVTNDVLGYLSQSEVNDYLDQIMKLPPSGVVFFVKSAATRTSG